MPPMRLQPHLRMPALLGLHKSTYVKQRLVFITTDVRIHLKHCGRIAFSRFLY